MDVLRQDAERIANFYQNEGFLEAKVGEPIVDQKEGALYITFPIDEGPRYKVGTVDLEGDLIKDKQAMLAELKIRDEEYLNRQVLRDDITRITDMYAEQGRITSYNVCYTKLLRCPLFTWNSRSMRFPSADLLVLVETSAKA